MPEPRSGRHPVDLETLLATRWGVGLCAIALLLAGGFLIRYAADRGLLGPRVRCVLAGHARGPRCWRLPIGCAGGKLSCCCRRVLSFLGLEFVLIGLGSAYRRFSGSRPESGTR